jgi:hypothetical protein
MSRILRRPMFRGGPASSDGVGITSGLNDGYATGGRVGYQKAGQVGIDLDSSYTDLYSPTSDFYNTMGYVPVKSPYEDESLNQSEVGMLTPLQRRQQIIAEREKQTSGTSPRERLGLPLTTVQKMEKEGIVLTGTAAERQKQMKQYQQDEANKNKNIKKVIPEDDYKVITQPKYTPPTLSQDIDTYSKLLMENAGPDKDEYTRQKYLTLAKFGLNLLKPTPAGIPTNFLTSVATAAEKPLEEYANISMQESKEGKALKQLASQIAIQKHTPGNVAKGIQDLMTINPNLTSEEATTLYFSGKNPQAVAKEKMLEVENKKKEIEDLATKDASLKKLSKMDPNLINDYARIAVEQGLYNSELKGLASDYNIHRQGSIYFYPDKKTGELLPHKFLNGKFYSIREPEFKQKGI